MGTALGFRAHSGWAAVVVVGGTIDAPHVLARLRIAIADPSIRGSSQPYHTAAELPLRKAEAFLRDAVESSGALAFEAISAIVTSFRSHGHPLVRCGILRGSGPPLPALDRILASHPRIHTAEGEMFRDVLASAAQRCGLSVTDIREKAIDAASIGRIASLGKLLGPPWTLDQKYATIAALTALGVPESN